MALGLSSLFNIIPHHIPPVSRSDSILVLTAGVEKVRLVRIASEPDGCDEAMIRHSKRRKYSQKMENCIMTLV